MSNGSSNHGRIIKVSKTVDTDWFATDISVSPSHHNMWMHKFTMQIRVSTTTILNLQYTLDGVTEVYDLNSGVAQPGGAVHIYDILAPQGSSFNIQHKTSTQDVSCILSETKTAMIG